MDTFRFTFSVPNFAAGMPIEWFTRHEQFCADDEAQAQEAAGEILKKQPSFKIPLVDKVLEAEPICLVKIIRSWGMPSH